MHQCFVLMALYWSGTSRDWWCRGAWGVVAILAIISITHLSLGRTGVVLVAAALLSYALAELRDRRALMLAGIGTAVLAVSVLTSSIMQERIALLKVEVATAQTDNLSSIGQRLYNYRTVPLMIAQRPVFGWGTGAYHTQICRTIEEPAQCQVFNWHPHNQFLFFGAEHGLIGVLALVWLIFSVVRYGWSLPRPGRVVPLGFAVILLVDCLFNSPLWSAREAHFFIAMMALVMAGPAWRQGDQLERLSA